jgi:hypothetical protein
MGVTSIVLPISSLVWDMPSWLSVAVAIGLVREPNLKSKEVLGSLLIGGTSPMICKSNLGVAKVEGTTTAVVIMGEAGKGRVRF